jgi:UDP-glucuronate decarboxylase
MMSVLKSNIISEDIDYVLNTKLPWERLKNSCVLISGANGFLPAYLVYTLDELNRRFNYNIKIIALARNEAKARNKFSDLSGNFELIIQDVVNPVSYNGAVDYIIHAASQASPKYYGVDPVGTLNANTIGTNNLLELARKNKATKFLYFSSSEVYGIIGNDKIPTSENEFGFIDPANVRSCYAESKRMGETICVSWSHQYGINVSMVRPFHTYGPGMDLQDGRVYADFVSDILNSRDIVMKSEGTAQRAFCYLSDATAGFFTVLLNGADREAYNIGNPSQEISILNLSEKLVGLFPEKKLKVIKFRNEKSDYLPSQVNRNSPDIAKAMALGWKPVTTIESGFKRTVESYL